MSLFKHTQEHLAFRSLRREINQDIRKMAKRVAKAAPKPDDGKTILSFNASTRITGLSLNAAFAMLTGWSLRMQGAGDQFCVPSGMSRCVMGTNQTDVYQVPPCQKCLAQSRVIYDRSRVSKMIFSSSEELAKVIAEHQSGKFTSSAL
jgi:hypothetical protein